VEQPPVIQKPSAAPRKKQRGKLVAFLIVLGILIAAAFVAALKNKPLNIVLGTVFGIILALVTGGIAALIIKMRIRKISATG
jgi:hypothetical protein